MFENLNEGSVFDGDISNELNEKKISNMEF
jgi:hypothetical protein